MVTHIVRRVLESIPLLLGITVLVFGIANLLPGGPMAYYSRVAGARAEDLELIRHQLGLDQPLPVQYVKWLGRWIQGDWGTSYHSREPVVQIIKSRFGPTALLLSIALAISLVVGLGTGIVAALKQYSLVDNVLTIFAFIGFCVPVYWLGLIMIYVFTMKLGWLPGGGMYTLGEPYSLGDRLMHLVMPVAAAALYPSGMYARYLRSGLLEVINLDYIRTARAKGLKERAVLFGHALRNALIPVVTIVAMDIPWLFGGAVLTETIFSWPGMGRQFWTSAMNHDYPVLMSWVMLMGIAVVVCNLLADILYSVLDPRIRYG